LLDLAQVRLLRGPQGAAFGRNGAAGIIEMSTPDPAAQLGGGLRLDAGSYNAWGAHLGTSGPLGGGVSHTLQLYHQERDGYINDPTLGRAIDDRSLTGGLVNLFWKPSPDTEWRLRVQAEQADDGAQRLSSLFSPDPFVVQSNEPGRNDMERLQVSLHWTKEASWGRLKSISSWQEWKLDPSITDLDFMALGPVYDMRSTIYQDQRVWSQELRWESPQDAGPWSWRTGLFWMDQALGGDATREFPAPVAPGVWMPFSERTLFDIDQANVAAYGRLTYALNDATELQGGARLEYVSSSIDRSKTDSFFQTSVVRDDLEDWYVSPEIGLSQALNDQVRWSARSAIGIKPAGFSAFASTPATASYDEETAWNNELGLEVSLPDQHLEFGLTGFCNLIDDYQLNRPDRFSTDYFTVNADQVTSLGIEAQARWRPVEQLTVHAAAGWVQTEFDDYFDPLWGVSRDGNAVPYVPEFSGCLGLRYDFPKGFYAQTSLRANGPTYFNDANNSAFRQGAYLVWDAEIGYAHDRFSIALYGRNLTDKEYYTFINPEIQAGAPGDPQVFGIRATLTF
jgi:iron complex outermembrane receptor protein